MEYRTGLAYSGTGTSIQYTTICSSMGRSVQRYRTSNSEHRCFPKAQGTKRTSGSLVCQEVDFDIEHIHCALIKSLRCRYGTCLRYHDILRIIELHYCAVRYCNVRRFTAAYLCTALRCCRTIPYRCCTVRTVTVRHVCALQ